MICYKNAVYVYGERDPNVVLLQFARLDEGKSQRVELFRIERNGVHYLLQLVLGSMLHLDVLSAGSRKSVKHVMDLAIENYVEGIGGIFGRGSFKLITTEPDDGAYTHLRLMLSSEFGITDWPEPEDITTSAKELREFNWLLDRQIKDWKGSWDRELRVTKHRYWPTFERMVHEEVEKEYGDTLVLYRGVYGDLARDVINGAPLPTYEFASWTMDKEYAKDFVIGDPKLGPLWVVVKKKFSPEDVVFAPVTLPDYEPDPTVLQRFRWEDEFVIHHRTDSIPRSSFAIAYRTRSKRLRS